MNTMAFTKRSSFLCTAPFRSSDRRFSLRNGFLRSVAVVITRPQLVRPNQTKVVKKIIIKIIKGKRNSANILLVLSTFF